MFCFFLRVTFGQRTVDLLSRDQLGCIEVMIFSENAASTILVSAITIDPVTPLCL